MTCVALFGLILVAISIGRFSTGPQNPNSLLTGRWLVSLKGAPNPMRYVEFSPSGNVTCYKLDGTTIDMVPGYSENWSVRGNIIETIGQSRAPAKPLLATVKEVASRLFSSEREPSQEPTRYAYTIDDDSTLQLELLDSPTPHFVTLKRVPALDEQHTTTSNKAVNRSTHSRGN